MVFDLRVTHRDKKDGSVSKKTPYRLTVSKEHGSVFERGGKKYREDGSPMGGAQVGTKDPKTDGKDSK